ncbi:hypothetical protein DFJ74DRAFT_48224 [Hyaloraphidium curvatum]|nr:hypothetical protein DFJ74DRAFT_48224 [Hyaloraphidium curvatum]
MPRQLACLECRKSKKDCRVPAAAEQCERCAERGLACVVPTTMAKPGPKGPRKSSAASRKRPQVREEAVQSPASSSSSSAALPGLPLEVVHIAPLPENAATLAALAFFFELTESPAPMIHRDAAGARSPFFVASALALLPFGMRAAGFHVPPDWTRFPAMYAARAASELAAVLDRPEDPGPAAFSALSNIQVGALLAGRSTVAAQLLQTAHALLAKHGYLRPLPKWRDAAAAELGRDATPAAYRAHYLEFYSRIRISNSILLQAYVSRGWTRRLDLMEPLHPSLRRPAFPSSVAWRLTNAPTFDPRSVPVEPLLCDAVGWIDLAPGSSERAAALAALPNLLQRTRQALPFLAAALRCQVDRFLVGCRLAGLHSPSELPVSPPGDLPRPLASLVLTRDSLSRTLSEALSAIPAEAQLAFSTGSAEALVSAFPTSTPAHARNQAPLYLALALLPLELWTSFGLPFAGEDPSDSGTRLALEMSHHPGLLASAISTTRLLRSLTRGAPVLNHTPYAIALSLCHLHGSAFRLLSARLPGSPAALECRRDAEDCLDILRGYSGASPGAAAALRCAIGVVSGAGLAKEEFDRAMFAGEGEEREGVEELLAAYGRDG